MRVHGHAALRATEFRPRGPDGRMNVAGSGAAIQCSAPDTPVHLRRRPKASGPPSACDSYQGAWPSRRGACPSAPPSTFRGAWASGPHLISRSVALYPAVHGPNAPAPYQPADEHVVCVSSPCFRRLASYSPALHAPRTNATSKRTRLAVVLTVARGEQNSTVLYGQPGTENTATASASKAVSSPPNAFTHSRLAARKRCAVPASGNRRCSLSSALKYSATHSGVVCCR